ncbi:MAG: helix-turn-helix transcriptional regulator [Selenomonadaceae bacterium]|nr:helix-turn-helix transcriptional regulator [Selenomonadaceae bacterium]
MSVEEDFVCPVDVTLKLIGGKYKPIILYHLFQNTLRFNQLHKLIRKATQKVLTQQLRELEHDGIIHREVYPVVPPKTEYSLTEFGRTLYPVIAAMSEFGKSFLRDKRKG